MKYVFFLAFVGLSSVVFAQSGPGVTYQGRLLKPDGTPVTASNVQFRIQIRTQSPSSCLMYEETQVKDLSGSLGSFAITVNDGSATDPNSEPYSLEDTFRNMGSITFPAGKCTGSNSVTFTSTSSRQIYVSFNDGSFSGWEPLPPQQINFVPMALDAVHFRGRTPLNFFRVEDAGVAQSLGAWSSANYTKLTDLIANTTISGGNASIGGNAAGFTGSLTGDVTGGQNSTKVEKIQGRNVLDTPPANGQVLTWNHANLRWEPANPAGGTETDPTVETFAQNPPSADFTTPSGVLTLATVPVSKGGTGATTASGARTNLGLGTAATKDFGSSAGNLVELDGSGKVPASLLPTQSGTYFAQSGNAFGAPAVLGTTDAQPLHLQTGGTNKVTILNNGNVGIGTTSPTSLLTVAGDASINSVTVGRGGGNLSSNTVVGPSSAFATNASGLNNSAVGAAVLSANTTGSANSGFGSLALTSNTTGGNNTGVGVQALTNNTTSGHNTGIGFASLYGNTTGSNNTAVGAHAGAFDGSAANNATSTNSVYLGSGSKPLASGGANEIVIGWNAVGNGSNSITLGGAAITKTVLQGNVGIGNTSPQAKLDVSGTIRANEICDEAGLNCKDISSGWGAGGDIDGIVTNSGSGLTGGAASGTATLSLVTDGSTVEVNGSNQLQVKDSGITTAKIGNLQVTDAKIAGMAVNKITSGAGLYLTYDPNGSVCADGAVLKKTTNGWECGTDSSFTTPLTTKGDIYVRHTTADTRLPVGADGKVLKADSTQTTGLIWGDAIATDIASLATTGIVQRNGAGSYSTVTVASPLTYTGGTLGLDATSFGDVRIDGNTVSSTMTIGTNSGHALALETGGTTKMTVLSSGNVGIGTTNPTSGLHLAGSSVASYFTVQDTAHVYNNAGLTGGISFKDSAESQYSFFGPSAGAQTLYSWLPIYLNVNNNGGVYVNSSGRVGIGSTNPTAPLYVTNSGDVTNFIVEAPGISGNSAFELLAPLSTSVTNGKAFSIRVPAETFARSIFYTDGKLGLGGGAATRDVFLSRQGAGVMKISGDGASASGSLVVTGNVGIGTTNPSAILHVAKNGSGNSNFIVGDFVNGTTNNQNGIGITALNTGHNYLDFKTQTGGYTYFRTGEGTESGAQRNWMSVAGATGNVGIGTSTPQSTLDVSGTIRANEICDEAGLNCKDLSSGWGAGGDIDGIVTNSGSGLTGGAASGTATLSLVTDGSTVEVNGSNQLQIKDSGITTAKIGNLQVTDAKIQSMAVNKITSGSGLYLTYAPDNTACTPGQVLKWNNSRWECGTDSTFTSPLTTKGDIYIRNATVDTRLPAGADGKVLKADSTQGAGLVWGDAIATDIASLATTGIVQRNGAGSYSTVTVASPLTYTGGTLGLDATGFGDVKLDGNTVSSTMTIGTNSAHDLALETGGTAKMTVKNGGSVGIGTASPQSKLHIHETTGGNSWVQITNADTGASSSDGFFVGINSSENAYLWNGENTSTIFYTGGTARMALTSAGDLGIGTTTPQEKLDVKGTDGTWARVVNTASTTSENMGFQAVNYMNGQTNGPTFWAVNYRGTEAAPAPVQSGDMLLSLGASGGRDAAWNVNEAAFLKINATENFSASTAGSSLSFFTVGNGTTTPQQRMIINHNGNVGIGTSSPSAKLQVNGGSIANDTSILLTQTNSASNSVNAATLDPYIWDTTAGSEDTGMSIVVKQGGVDKWVADFSDSIFAYMPIQAQGYWTYFERDGDNSFGPFLYGEKSRGTYGAKTAVQSGDTLLNIVGRGYYNGTSYNEAARISFTAAQNYTSTAGGGSIYFATAANNTTALTERMVINQAGNVGFGTTSPWTDVDLTKSKNGGTEISISNVNTGTSAYAQFSAYNDASQGYMLAGIGGVNWPGLYGDRAYVASGTGTSGLVLNAEGAVNPVIFATDTTERMRILTNGNVGIGVTAPSHILHINGQGRATNTAWAISSDRRLKDIEGHYQYGLDELLKMNTVWFRYKKDNPLGLPSDKVFPGVVAQEMKEIIPEAVHMESDGYYTLNVDPIHWATVNAVKELHGLCQMSQNQLSSLKAKNAEQDRRLASLEAENERLKLKDQEKDREIAELKARLDRIEKAIQSK